MISHIIKIIFCYMPLIISLGLSQTLTKKEIMQLKDAELNNTQAQEILKSRYDSGIEELIESELSKDENISSKNDDKILKKSIMEMNDKNTSNNKRGL